MRRANGAVREQSNAAARKFGRKGVRDTGADVDYTGDFDARIGQREDRLVGGIVVGKQDGTAARDDRVSPQIVQHGVGQHDAGPIVVRKHQRTFGRPRRDENAPSANLPQAFAGSTVGRRFAQMIGQTLMQYYEVVVVIADGRGACEYLNI